MRATMPPVPLRETMPHSIESEELVLSGMLASTEAVGVVTERLRAEFFYRPAHTMIFTAIADLYGEGAPTDVVSVAARLGRQGLLERAGGPSYLRTLLSAYCAIGSVGYHANLVAATATARRVIEAADRAVQLAYTPGVNVDDLLTTAQDAMYAAAGDDAADDMVRLGDLLGGVVDDTETAGARDAGDHGLRTGIMDLDEATDGPKPGQLWVVAARPGVGKSVMGLNFCRAVSIAGSQPSVLFSMEMSRAEIAQRAMSAEARVPLHGLRTGRLRDEDWELLVKAIPRVADAALWIDDTANTALPNIRAKAQRIKNRHGLAIVVVDYLQLMAASGRSENRQQEIAAMSRGLKRLAKDLDIPVVALSQLNRASEQRADRRPQLGDMRESGAIENDADVVVLLHRPDQHERECERAGEIDLIIAKNRSGPLGIVTCAWQGQYARIVDMAS